MSFSNDLRYAFRKLGKAPGFVVAVLATIAICLGANLMIFAVVDAVLLRTLPFPQSDRLVTLYYTYPKLPNASSGASLTTYFERRGQIPALSSLSAISLATSVIGEPGATSIENLGRVSWEFFATLGVEPLIGRAFQESEMTYQTDHVAILSYEYWHSQFNEDPSVVGKTLRLDGISRTIVGVLPPHFRFLSFQAPVYMPLSSEEAERNIPARHALGTIQIARLAPGATLADAQAQVAAHDAAHAAEFPDAKIVADAGCRTVVAPLRADHVAAVRPTLVLLQAGALLLLVIGAVNLVNLLLIRASGRARELAIRRALGAGQGEVVREVMTETLLLAFGGALLGLAVGAAGVRLVGLFGARQLPLGADIVFDLRLAAVGLAGAVMTGLAIGLPIVWFNLRSGLTGALQSESRGSTINRAAQRVRHSFIIAQIGLAFVLLVGASLLGLSLKRAMDVSPGFRTDHIITGRFNLTWFSYHTPESFPNFFNRLHEKTRAIPGVIAAGAVSTIPVVGNESGNTVTVPGYTLRPGETVGIHDSFVIAGNYFAAMGIPLREGRYLDQADEARDNYFCVVDENFARHYWPNTSAVGQQVYRGTVIEKDEKPYLVVGVVGAVKQGGLTSTRARGAIYFSYAQVFNRNYFLVARSSLPAESLSLTLAKVVREVDPDMPLTDLRSMDVRIDESLSTRRSPALLAGIFAATALLLATIGLYGVMAYSVAQRTNEFGIRMALGAQRLDILSLVFNQGLRLVFVGLACGLAIALLLTDVMSSLLFDIRANDPLTLAAVAGLLAGIAALASLLPARHATKVDPMIALRAD